MSRSAVLLFALLGSATACVAQLQTVYTIETVAGGAVYDGLPATSTPLSFPTGLWLDREGGLWVADTRNNVIRRLDPASGAMRVMAGGGTTREDATAIPASAVQLELPSFLVGDASGNVFFSDTGSNRVRRLSADGLVTTIAGTGESGFSGDGGAARLARLNRPTGVAFDSTGRLYIADSGNCRIRRIDTSGVITTFAGSSNCAAGPSTLGGDLRGLAFDRAGSLYVGGGNSNRLFRIDGTTPTITTIAGNGTCCGPPPDGAVATETAVSKINSVAFDEQGNLFFTFNTGLAKIVGGRLTNLGGFGGDHGGVVRASDGFFFVAAGGSSQILRISGETGPVVNPPGGRVAGATEPFDGPALQAILTAPRALSLDSAGRLYISDRGNRRIRRYDPATGTVSTVAGGGSAQPADGLSATAVALGNPFCVHVDRLGNIFFDFSNAVWRVSAAAGTLARIAGRPTQSFGPSTGDGGPALDATFGQIYGLITDAAGNLFISDFVNNRVRRVDAATGVINTIAGNGNSGISGDGGPATAAAVQNPASLVFDSAGRLLIAGTGIRQVNLSTGVITTLDARLSSGATVRTADLASNGLAMAANGDLFFTESNRVRQVRASDRMLLDIAGTSTPGFFGDGGPASLARLSIMDGGIAVDSSGNVYIADTENNRIRKLSLTTLRPVLAVSPGTLFFTQQQGSTILTAQAIAISSANALPLNWSLEISTASGGNWLSASSTSGTSTAGGQANVLLTVNASRLGAGAYRATVTVRASEANNSPQTVDVVLSVTGTTAGAVIGLSQQFVSFQAVQGGSTPTAQTISVSNAGSGTLSWQAVAATSSGGNWLRISPELGTAPSTLTVSAEVSGLAQGVYQGQVTLRNLTANETRIISVVLTVTRQQPSLLPSQTGFLFVGVEGSLVIGPQSFAMQNAGQGRMNWTVVANLPGGGEWLRVSPSSGTSEAGQLAPQVTLQVDPSRLRAGISVALLSLTAEGAANSPQTAIVLVNMLPRGSLPVGSINPLGVIFTAQAGATTALAQGISIASTGGQALQFLVRARTAAGGNWLTVTPEQGVLLSSAESANLSVQAQPRGLAAGVYLGTITLTFATGITQEVAVALVVAPAAAAMRVDPQSAARAPQAACTPRRLVVVEKRLGSRFALDVSWPIPLLAEAVDDCGTRVTNGAVSATFTNGDPPLPFRNLLDGHYAATWVPARGGTVGVTVRAVAPALEDGVTQFAGNLGASSTLPLLFRDSWVNAASFAGFRPLAPGMIFSLFGSNLARGNNVAGELPLPRQLGDLKVTMGGVDVPLFYAGEGQVNAQVPFEMANVRSTSIVATGRGSAGAPGNVTIVDAQPGIFTVSQSGTGQGIVVDAQNRIVDAANAVARGDVVVIYATGLGVVEPPVPTGTASPLTVLSRVVTPVTVTIGGQPAQVDFAGLVPGLVGLYQVNARVPESTQAGSSVPVVITQNGVTSNTVTIAVR